MSAFLIFRIGSGQTKRHDYFCIWPILFNPIMGCECVFHCFDRLLWHLFSHSYTLRVGFLCPSSRKNECSIEYKFRKLWISTSVRLYQAVPTATATVKTMYQCSISIFTIAFCPAHSPMYNINQFQCLFLCYFPVDCDLSTENVNSHKNAAQKFIMLQINFIYVLLRGHQIWTAMCSDFFVCQSLHSMAYFRFLVLSLSWVYHTICVICCGI